MAEHSRSTPASNRIRVGIALVLLVGLALPLTAIGGAATVVPKGGLYEGPTDQGKRGKLCYGKDLEEVPCSISFRVKKRVVRNATFSIAWPNCSTSFPMSPETGTVNSNGGFTVREGDAVLKGKFVSKTKVTGKVTGEPVKSGQFPGCKDPLTVKFTVRRKSG